MWLCFILLSAMDEQKTLGGSDYGAGPLISTKEAARLIGVTAATLGNWRKANAGPRCFVFGHDLKRCTVRYRLTDVEQWIAGRITGGG